jgi:hypothetical protein
MLLRKLDFDLLPPAERQAAYGTKSMLGLVFRCDQMTTFQDLLSLIKELQTFYSSETMPPLIVIGTCWDLVPESEKYMLEQKVKQTLMTLGLREFYYVAANPPINIPVVYVRFSQLASTYYPYPDTPQSPHQILLIGVSGTGKNTLIQRFKDLGYGVEENPPEEAYVKQENIPATYADSSMKYMEDERRPPRFTSSTPSPSPPSIASVPGGDGAPSPSIPMAGPMASPPPKKVSPKDVEKKLAKEDTKERSKMMAPAFSRKSPMDDFEQDESEILEQEESIDAYLPPSKMAYAKNLSVEYFDKMNPEKYYPLIVNIANEEQADIAAQENIVTGERKIQKKEVMEVELTSPKVTVRPIFPGCSITPNELITNFDRAEDELKFFITPLVNDEINGRIDFINSDGDIVYQMHLTAEVDDPRYAKTIAAYGTAASVLPKILLFFDIDIGNEMSMESLVPLLGGILGQISLTNFIAFAGVFVALLVGGVIFIKRKPRSTTKRFTLGDLRVAKIKSIKK